jgi:hypothetical protein
VKFFKGLIVCEEADDFFGSFLHPHHLFSYEEICDHIYVLIRNKNIYECHTEKGIKPEGGKKPEGTTSSRKRIIKPVQPLKVEKVELS